MAAVFRPIFSGLTPETLHSASGLNVEEINAFGYFQLVSFHVCTGTVTKRQTRSPTVHNVSEIFR